MFAPIHAGDSGRESERADALIHLLFWTGPVAVVFAVGRILLPADAWGGEHMRGDMALIFILITAFNALIAIPLTLVLLLERLGWALTLPEPEVMFLHSLCT